MTTWLLLAGLLLQSVLWVLPAQRVEVTERLAHEWVHALDQGEHRFDSRGHDADPSLALDEDAPQSVHSHASEGVQLQGLLLAVSVPMPPLPPATPGVGTPLQPPSAHLDGLLRPPRAAA